VRFTFALVFVVLFVPCVAAQSATTSAVALPPQVERALRYVPDDTHLAVVVPSVDALVVGLSAFGKATGLPDVAEVTARGLLDKVLDQGAAALDTTGPLLLALTAGHDEPLLIAALKSDESWKAATQPTVLRDDVLLYEFGPDRYVAASVGGVAIFAREKAELRRALDATGAFGPRLVREAGALLSQRQVVFYADVTAWQDTIDTRLDLVAQATSVGMVAAGPEGEASLQVWNWMLERLKRMLVDGQVYVGSGRVNAQGVFVDSRATFKPDSSVERYLKELRRPKHDLLRGLPAGEGPIVMAFEWEEAPGAEGFNAALAKALMNMESIRQKVGAEKLEAVLQQSVEMNRKVPGASAVFGFSPEGQGLLYWGLYLTQEGGPVQREMRRLCELTPELMSAWGAFPAAMTPSAPEEVAGVAADVYQFNFEAQDSPRQPMVEMLYGKNPALYMAPHPEGVAYAFGPREEARARLARLLNREAAPLSKDPRVVDLFKVLTADPQMCILADIPGILRSAAGLLEQVGLRLPTLELGAAQTPLAGFTFYLEPAAPRVELFVPAEPIKALVDIVKELEGKTDEPY
jgi:hypothetical protein